MSGMRGKVLACLVFVLCWILAGQAGLLDLVPVPQGFALPSPGGWLFPGGHGHAFLNIESVIVDLFCYGLALFIIVSALFRVFAKLKGQGAEPRH